MKIPNRFINILLTDQSLHSTVLAIVSDFQPILKDNKLFFFEEYTDHGIEHIEAVLRSASEIITEQTYDILTAKDVALLIMSIILHDLAMHIEFSTFNAFIGGSYDDCRQDSLDEHTWAESWEQYLSEAKRFSSKQRLLYFGNERQPFRLPDLTNKDALDGADKKLIGEFVRRHHTRFAHEVAIKGLLGSDGKLISFGGSRLPDLYKKLVGIIARSHGMDIRKTFSYLHETCGEAWKRPDQIHITYLMVVLRIADYFQFDKSRVDTMLLKVKTFNSPVSNTEHQKHLSITLAQPHPDDLERLYVYAEPDTSVLFLQLETLLLDIQFELDMSWAVLGEIYSKSPMLEQPKIKYRRITSNLEEASFRNSLPYLASRVVFKADVELPKLLIAPLYGDMPTFGVRELLQNAIDACTERAFYELKVGSDYTSAVNISLTELDTEKCEFRIHDNGKGMTLDEIRDYFLRIGSSFRKSLDWQKHFTDELGKSLIHRNGKFGIGVLAAFLLGGTLQVTTRHFKSDIGYRFETTLDADQIEVQRDPSLSSGGTSISIIAPGNLSELLELGTERAHSVAATGHYMEVPPWTNWYQLEKPSIQYTVNGEKVMPPKRLRPTGKRWHEFRPSGFSSIKWSFVTDRRNESLICNGIVVPNFETYISSEKAGLINSMPTLVIADAEGNLPLSLDRSRLAGPLPFFDDLIEDMARDLVANMLTLQIDMAMAVKELSVNFRSSVPVLFSKNGYTFLIDYFLLRCQRQNYQLIRIVTPLKSIKYSISQLDPRILLEISRLNQIGLSYPERHIRPEFGGRVAVPINDYKLYFDPNKNRVTRTFKKYHKVEEATESVVIYNYDYSLPPTKTYSDVVSSELRDGGAILEVGFPDAKMGEERGYGRRAGTILTLVLERYFGDKVLIPYSKNQRKKLFPLAFQELAGYMEKYLDRKED